jgi:hypothetical protein
MFRKWLWIAGYEAFCSCSEKPVVMLLDRDGPVGRVHAVVAAMPEARSRVRDCSILA